MALVLSSHLQVSGSVGAQAGGVSLGLSQETSKHRLWDRFAVDASPRLPFCPYRQAWDRRRAERRDAIKRARRPMVDIIEMLAGQPTGVRRARRRSRRR